MRKTSMVVIILIISASVTGCNESTNKQDPSIDKSSVLQSEVHTENNTNEIRDILSIVPAGWHILNYSDAKPVQAEGDLNKDGISDIALVIEETTSAEEAPPRAIIVAFGNVDNTYTLSINTNKVIMRADEGGIWGDPFESISIDRGSVLIKDYGGSNWRWYNSYRFRYQDHDWYLIGATMGTYFTGTTTRDNANEEDYNLLTGDYIIRTKDESGEINTIKGNRGKRKLVKLKDFNMNDM